MLRLQHVEKYYAAQRIFQPLTFALDTGIYWIKGANGSGKTTFLKMIAGQLSFDGDIILKGYSLKQDRVRYLQQVSWAEAEPVFPVQFTGYDLLQLYSTIRKAPAKQTLALIDHFQMGSWIQQPIKQYSSGRIKLLSLVLAFTGTTAVIVLDEPLISLDKEALASVSQYLSDVSKTGILILLSSHQELTASIEKSSQVLTVQHQTVYAAS